MEIKELQKLIRSKREEKNIKIEELSLRLKTTKDTIYNLENYEDFIENNKPYSLYLLKAVCKELDINFYDNKIKNISDNNLEKNEEEIKSDFIRNMKKKIINIFKLSFLSFVIFPLIGYIYYLNDNLKNENQVLSFAYEIPDNLKNTSKTLKDIDFNDNSILIISKKDIWMSAKIDGEDKVFNISKNKKINIKFQEKIHFITIGNANNVIIYYKGKKITFNNEKVIHNLFVDKDGIFKNGYNLIGNNS